MSVIGTTVVVESAEEYERLTQLPESIDGWFDPAAGVGEVRFATVAQAQAAYREGV